MRILSIATIITVAFAVVAEASGYDGNGGHKEDPKDHNGDKQSHPTQRPTKWCDRQCQEVISLAKECHKQKKSKNCLCSKEFQKELDQCRGDGCSQNYKKKWGRHIEPLLKDCKYKNNGGHI